MKYQKNYNFINNKYHRKTRDKWLSDAFILLALLCGVMIGAYANKFVHWLVEASEPIVYEAPIITKEIIEIKKVDVPDENVPAWVQKYVDRYFEGYQRSEMYMIMHCLLHRESGHQAYGENDNHGDSGRAGGILQYWDDTYKRMRKQMLKDGEIIEIGSRYNPEQAIHTTVWAIKNGRAQEWGPLLRGKNGSDFASCQFPSWYEGE